MERRGIVAIGAITILVASALPVAATSHAEPTLGWAHGIGGAGSDSGQGVAVDVDGSVYVTGFFWGEVDFGSGPPLSSNGFAMFVAKYDTDGGLEWAHGIGGIGAIDEAFGYGIAVDGDGSVYVTGFFSGEVDFDPGGDGHTLSNGQDDIFVAKYDTAGGLEWAHGIGGTGFHSGYGIAVDGGYVYVTGVFNGEVDFGQGPLLSGNVGSAMFVAKYDTAGGLEWAHGVGGTDVTDVASGEGIAVDGDGSVYVTGFFRGEVDFGSEPPLSSSGQRSIFVAKYDTDGDLEWAHGIGGTGFDSGYGVAVDGDGSVYVTGEFSGEVDFDPGGGGHTLTSNGPENIFVAKYDTDGGLEWAHGFGGGEVASGEGIAVDGDGNVYVTGSFQGGFPFGSVDFDPGPDEHRLSSNGQDDIFVAKYDTAGDLEWAHNFGGGDQDFGYGVAVDGDGNVYVTGSFQEDEVDFDPGPDEHRLSSQGFSDIFVLKLDAPPDPDPDPDPDPVVAPTVGLVDPTQGLWHLRNSLGAVTTFYFGNPGDYPFMGDWNCDGVDTPGMYRQSDGFVYLRNSNTQGIADITFFFGNPGDIPIVGDFNNNGCDTVSIYRPSNQTFYIINQLGQDGGGLGAAEFSYVFGNPGDKPFTGDFNGNGVTTVGLHRESTGLVYFRNTHTQGNADAQFFFGNPNDRFIAGDWNANGIDTPAVFRPSNTTFYFRHTNTQGNADTQFVWGQSGWLPVAGNFGLG